MTDVDLQDLAENYSRMSESDLMDAAAGYDELVDSAQSLLRAEFAKRGLEPPLVEDADNPVEAAGEPDAPVDTSNFVTVATFDDPITAEGAQAGLDSIGINSVLDEQEQPRVRQNTILVLLRVAPEDVAEAKGWLADPNAARKALESIAAPDRPICPKCASLDTVMLPHSNQSTTDSILVNSRQLPGQPSRDEWKCNNCGTRWFDDDGVPE